MGMTSPLLLALLALLAGLAAPTTARAQDDEACGSNTAIARDVVPVRLVGAVGQECHLDVDRAWDGKTYVVDIVTGPAYGKLDVSATTTRIKPDAWRIRYRPKFAETVHDTFGYQVCRMEGTQRRDCHAHEVTVELSEAGARERRMVCRPSAPVPVDFASRFTVELTGPRGSPCWLYFPHAPQFWWKIPTKPTAGTANYRSPYTFEYLPNAPTVERDDFVVEICADEKRTMCSLLDMAVRYRAP